MAHYGNCLGCTKMGELLSLRAFKERMESGREIQNHKDTISNRDNMITHLRGMLDKKNQQLNDSDAELRDVKKERNSLRTENARLQKELNAADERTEKAVSDALNAQRRQFDADLQEMGKQAHAEQQAAIELVRQEMQNVIDAINSQLQEANRTIEKMKLALSQSEKEKSTLQEKLDKPEADGSNSGIPTSQTPIGQKKIIPAAQRGQGLKKGGQPGHPGHFHKLFPDDEPGLEVNTIPVENAVCPCCGKPMHKIAPIIRDSADIEIVVHKRRNIYEVFKCDDCNKKVHAQISEKESGPFHYGPTTQALMLLLMERMNVPMGKACEFIDAISERELGPCASFAAKLPIRAAKILSNEFIQELKLAVVALPLVIWDDTVISINTHRACMRNYGSKHIALYEAHWTKGRDTLDLDGILALLDENTACCHDHTTVNYNSDFLFMNLECVVHLIRAIVYLEDLTKHPWTTQMLELVRGAIHKRKQAIAAGEDHLSDQYLSHFWKEYESILADGELQCERDGSKYYVSQERGLIVRMRNYAANYFAWIDCFLFPTTSSCAERALRIIKGKCKTSGQFETVDSARDYGYIMSYLETCARNNIDLLEATTRLLEGKPYTLQEILPPEEWQVIVDYKARLANLQSNGMPAETDNATTEAGTDNAEAGIYDEISGLNKDGKVPRDVADRIMSKIYAFMSTSHTSAEMRELLTARGLAKRLYRNEANPDIVAKAKEAADKAAEDAGGKATETAAGEPGHGDEILPGEAEEYVAASSIGADPAAAGFEADAEAAESANSDSVSSPSGDTGSTSAESADTDTNGVSSQSGTQKKQTGKKAKGKKGGKAKKKTEEKPPDPPIRRKPKKANGRPRKLRPEEEQNSKIGA